MRDITAARADVREILRTARVHVDSRISCTLSADLQVVGSRLDATAFMVIDVAEPSSRTRWACVLAGGYLVSEACLRTAGVGPCLKFHDPTLVHKELWVSPAVREKHDEVWAAIQRAAERPGSKWKLLNTRAEWVARYNSAVKSHRGPNIIAILSKKEPQDPAA